MPLAPRTDRAVRYACSVCADLRIDRLPVDPFSLAERAGISMVPLSFAERNPGWFPEDLPVRLQATLALTLVYPAFCIVFRDDTEDRDRLRFILCHELGHLFMNHYRDFPSQMGSRMPDRWLEEEADAFARNLLAPVPVVDVIRFNRPRLAEAGVFGMVRGAWMARVDALAADRAFVDEDMANTLIYLFHDYLLGRRCATCGHVFTDTAQANHCPRCGAGNPDWYLQGPPLSAPPEK